MLRIGLTGGIASGKTTVAKLFETLEVPVIDTDAIAREVVAPGESLLSELFRVFGSDLRRTDGSLDRSALRQRVFADPTLRHRLEAIMHPAIDAALSKRLAELPKDTPYVVLVIPLLIEAGWQDRVDRILLVDCPEALQLRRLVQRDRIDADAAERIIQSQASRGARLGAADDVIDNDGSLDLAALADRVRRLDRTYRQARA